MPKVKLKGEWEKFDSLLRRFKRSVEKSDILKDFRDHEFYEKKSETRKRAMAAARKRSQRQNEEAHPHLFPPRPKRKESKRNKRTENTETF